MKLPMFTTVSVMTRAIGIGANAAIFSVIEGVLLKPLPFSDSDQLVAVDHAAPGLNLESVGAAAFLYFVRLMSSLLFDVSPIDPLTYGTVALSLVAAAVVASYLPALRATLVDPVEALRAE